MAILPPSLTYTSKIMRRVSLLVSETVVEVYDDLPDIILKQIGVYQPLLDTEATELELILANDKEVAPAKKMIHWLRRDAPLCDLISNMIEFRALARCADKFAVLMLLDDLAILYRSFFDVETMIHSWGDYGWSCTTTCSCGEKHKIAEATKYDLKFTETMRKTCACGPAIHMPRLFEVDFKGAMHVFHAEHLRLRIAYDQEKVINGGHWDPYAVEEYDDCKEPHLISDLLFAVQIGMSKMIDYLLPLTVYICHQGQLQRHLHEALMNLNCKVAAQWAALMFEYLENRV